MSVPIHHAIITGTGRAGTTFLVQLLTELGLDTGFQPGQWKDRYYEHCRAGLEFELTEPHAPYIVKNPRLALELEPILAGGDLVVDHAFIPIRDLEQAALSRVNVGGSNGSVPGGVVYTDNPEQQAHVLAAAFHQMVLTLVRHEIPHTFLLFPRFVADPAYAYARLQPLLGGIDWRSFQRAFERTARPDLVHEFKAGDVRTATPAAPKSFLEKERRKGHRRLARRIGAFALIGCLVLTSAFRVLPPLRAQTIQVATSAQMPVSARLRTNPGSTGSGLSGFVPRPLVFRSRPIRVYSPLDRNSAMTTAWVPPGPFGVEWPARIP